jgi:hypothetical protein
MSNGSPSVPIPATLPSHHYVPKFVLKNFATPESGNKVEAYNKGARNVRLQATKHAATSPGYNTRSDNTDPVEQFLSREVETPAARAVALLVSGKEAGSITKDQGVALRKLLVAQTVRTPRARRAITDMVRGDSFLSKALAPAFDASGQLSMDGQLEVVASLLRAWEHLGPATWPLKLVPFGDSGTPLFVPDNGVFLYHPDLQATGSLDSSLDDMASAVMPLSPRMALVAVNPTFSIEQAVPAGKQTPGLVWGQADRFIYGRRGDGMSTFLSTMTSPSPEAVLSEERHGV